MATRSRLAQAAAAALGLLVVGPVAAGAPAADVFYERAVMTAADGQCRLFAPDVATALTAAKAQARGAALRSGDDPAALASAEAQASAAVAAAGCGSADIARAAQAVRAGFADYARLDHMDFPGDFAAWTAARPLSQTDVLWRASQRDRFGWDVMRFGLTGKGQDDRSLTAVASFADGAQPYAARLVLRDSGVTSGPFLDAREADIAGHIPIDGRLPPREQSRIFAATEMGPAETSLADDTGQGWAFTFPAEAIDALATLDPRESVAVEFLFAGEDGEGVRTAYVEVGDFAAARAFQAIPQA
jgi:hypothetical protein